MAKRENLIQTHGGYRNLKSFQVAQLVYDVTVRFCDQYIPKRSRTHDQMVQAARSGVQNIAEGSLAPATSKKTELKLTNVARASLGELRLDYEDFLRQRDLPLWEKDDPRRDNLVALRPKTANDVARWVQRQYQRGIAQSGQAGPLGHVEGAQAPTQSTESNQSTIPEIAANGILVLINVAMGLLKRQLDTLAKNFETEGGFTERLYDYRKRNRT